jgi:hypothetical protein
MAASVRSLEGCGRLLCDDDGKGKGDATEINAAEGRRNVQCSAPPRRAGGANNWQQ